MENAESNLTPIISTSDLIQKVCEHPTLWDRTCTTYRDKVAKDRAWLQICGELHPGFDTLKATQKRELIHKVAKKWHNVRDSYRKYLKNKNRDKREYLYANILTFMDGTYTNLDDDTYDEDRFGNDSNDNNNTSDNFENEFYLNFEEANVEPAPKKLRIEPLESSKKDDDIIAVLANLIHKEEDEDRAFFKSITPAVSKLSERSKFEFRIEVMNLLKNISKKDKKLKKLKVEEVSDSDSDV